MKPQHPAGTNSGSARITLPSVNLDALLAKLGAKDRQTFDRQLAARDARAQGDARLADRWRRLAGLLMTLASAPPKLAGSDAMQFYIPDGKYRKQVFAIHATADGSIAVFLPEILELAAKSRLLSGVKSPGDEDGDRARLFRIVDSNESLRVELLDGSTANPSPFYKDMTGWNRKAISVQLPPSATDEQVEAVERLCALAATTWPVAAAGAAPGAAVTAAPTPATAGAGKSKKS
jgi:hypothetical protein